MDDDSVDVDVADLGGGRTFTADEVKAIVEKRVSADRARGGGRAPEAGDRMTRVESALDRLAGLMAGRATSTTPTVTTAPPAAPSAPSGAVNPLTAGGILDVLALTPDQTRQLGPVKLREAFEQLLGAAKNEAGFMPAKQPAALDVRIKK